GAAAWQVGQAIEAAGGETRPPLAHRAGVASELLGHLLVGGAVALAAAEDEAAAKSLGFGGRVGGGHLAELVLFVGGEADEWRASGHGAHSLCQRGDP